MKRQPPKDWLEIPKARPLSDRDRRRIILMREESPIGAIEVSLRAYVRPAKSDKAFSRVISATKTITSFAALNAEQIINGGPLAGKNFAATDAMLELYEATHRKEKK